MSPAGPPVGFLAARPPASGGQHSAARTEAGVGKDSSRAMGGEERVEVEEYAPFSRRPGVGKIIALHKILFVLMKQALLHSKMEKRALVTRFFRGRGRPSSE